jgi:hypothetical protein
MAMNKIKLYSYILIYTHIYFIENVTALAKLYGIEVKKEGVKYMKTERLGIGFKLEKSDFKIKDSINMQNVIG